MTSASVAQQLVFRRMVLFWALAMLVLLGISGMSLAYMRAEFLDKGQDLVESYARVLDEQTSRVFQATDQRLQLAEQELGKLKSSGQLTTATANGLLTAQLVGHAQLGALWVLDATGKTIYDSEPGTTGLSLADREYFKAHLTHASNAMFIDSPVLSRRTGRWQFTVSRALRGPNEQLEGVIAASIEPSYLEALWRTVDLGDDSAISLVRLNGTGVMRSPFVVEAVGKDFSYLPLFTTRLPKAAHGTYRDHSAVDGSYRTFAYRTLSDYKMVLVVGTSNAFLLQTWYAILRVTAVVGVIVALVMAWLFYLLGKSWLRRYAAEELAHDNERTWHAMFDHSPVAQMLQLPFSTIISVNDKFVELTGYTRAELIGAIANDLALRVEDDLSARYVAALKAQGRVTDMELHGRRKGGEQRLLLVSSCPITHKGTVHNLHSFIDITQQRHQVHQLQLIEQVFSQALEGITVTDASGCIIRVNRAFTTITGYTEDEVLGKNPRILQSGLQSAEYYQTMWSALLTQGVWSGEIFNRHKDGTVYPEWLTISAIRAPDGTVTHYLASFNDLSKAKAAEGRIQNLSHFDPLTGLPNRSLLQDRTAHAISMVQRSKEPLCMMLVSIDHFKTINDTLGHHVGDNLLIEMGKRLSESVRDQDTVSHQAGKEFVLILPGTPPEGAAHLATEMLWTLAQPHQVGEHALEVTASIGLASFPDNGSDFDTLYKSVEIALHRAQNSGRDNFKFYSEGMYQEVLERDSMTKALRVAAERGELQVLYQPLGDLQTGKISGMEALLRWHHPERGTISPTVFIPIAEESGLIRSVGEWVLGQVCKDIRHWQDNGVAVPHVAVNVSPLQFHDKGFVQLVRSVVSRHGVAPELIHLEVTESALMDDAGRCEAMLRDLKALGFSLSLDDFGTGYSSLSYLKRYPFDKVKIDQSFVRDIGTSQTDTVIVKVIISMAHGLGLKVIAEGVETEAQCEIMRSNVCDEIQGYFFSRPVDAPTLESLLRDGCQLPAHLLRFRKQQRTLLLVDDEPNVISSLKRLLRRDGHTILSASSGAEGLEMLATHKVDVIISDQRMPGMTGVEFLREAKVRHPNTIRIVLSGYTELQSVTDAINEGAIYRFLTKPWDDAQLREQVEKAFEHKELFEENQQLDIKIRTTNQELVAANRHLGDVIHDTRKQVEADATSLAIVQEALQFVPMPVLGLDQEDVVIFLNTAAEELFGDAGPLLAMELKQALPELASAIAATTAATASDMRINGRLHHLCWNAMGQHSRSRGKLVTLARAETSP